MLRPSSQAERGASFPWDFACAGNGRPGLIAEEEEEPRYTWVGVCSAGCRQRGRRLVSPLGT